MPLSQPPPPPRLCFWKLPLRRRLWGLTHGDLDDSEVADAEGSPRVVSVDAEHHALGPAWRQLVLRFWSPQVSDGSKRDKAIKRGPVSDPEFVLGDTGVEGGCRTTV